MINRNFRRRLNWIQLTEKDYFAITKGMAEKDLRGGLIYDGLILAAAEKKGCEAVVTFNVRDFRRLVTALDLEIEITSL